MSKIQNKLKRDFTALPNALVQDDTLSDRARFLFVYMATKPASWEFYQKPLCKGLGWSADTLRKYMSELIAAGWITCQGQKAEDGKFQANQYTLHSYPEPSSRAVKKPNQEKTVSENFRHGKFPTLIKERLLQKKDYNKKERDTPARENENQQPPNWIEVAKQMAAYYKNEGKHEWEFMCMGVVNPPSPIAVTRQWAGKNQDAPYILENWRKNTAKLTNWIRNEAKANPGTPLATKTHRKPDVKSVSAKDRQQTAQAAAEQAQIMRQKMMKQ